MSMLKAYVGLMMFATGISKIFEQLPKTVDKICEKVRRRRHYKHKVEKRLRRQARGLK